VVIELFLCVTVDQRWC